MKGKNPNLPHLTAGLSARLLLLTIAFVMLAEVLIYAPSIARFRLVYLEERLADAHLAILTLDATPDQMVHEDLKRELLTHVEAFAVALTRPQAGKLLLMIDTPRPIDVTYDLRDANPFGLIRDAFVTLWSGGDRVLRVLGSSPKDAAVLAEVVLDERPLREAMIGFSNRILALSLMISLITAALVYLTLHWLMVRPMRRLTESMIAFRQAPENAAQSFTPSKRGDEIGLAQREFAHMQEGLRAALLQKTRLAALGTAVTKINHDLRNILATARLISDRLDHSHDPEVRQVTPTLVEAIDRAVNLCAQTLNFTREGPPSLNLSRFDLAQLVQDVSRALPAQVNGQPVWQSLLEGGPEIEADRDQIFRVLSNLAQNAIDAGATRVEVSARLTDARVVVSVRDDGPGLAPRARERLFQPFAGTARPGGTGLGLAIARDLVRAHGGEIRLESTTGAGTTFAFELPVSQIQR
jgi:signal transduction histidine kinase